MRIVLYGLPCSGKTTLLNKLSGQKVLCGSELLMEITDNKFQTINREEKIQARKELIHRLEEYTEDFIIDGHYMFGSDVVFTDLDATFYDVYLYLYERPNIIKERMENSSKNKKYSEFNIEEWQNIEIEKIRESCHLNNKNFFVLDDGNYENISNFINELIQHKHDTYNTAKEIVSQINKTNSLNLIDGDKTITSFDTSREFLGYKTSIFDNNFYTGYQMYLQSKELYYKDNCIDKAIEYNTAVINMISGQNNVILSSGLPQIWDSIGSHIGKIFAGVDINADTKYFIAKLLREEGITVTGYGDSLNDYYMLKESNIGYLITQGGVLSRSLKNKDLSDLKLINSSAHSTIINQFYPEDKSLSELILASKSTSGICGSQLALIHKKLAGNWLAPQLKKYVNPKQTGIIAMERSGHFLGTELYLSGVGSQFAVYDDKSDNWSIDFSPIIDTVIIVDGVINSGKSIIVLADNIKKRMPNIKRILFATACIQKDSENVISKKYEVISIRASENKFTGSRQNKVENGKGPDTSDRLFGLL